MLSIKNILILLIIMIITSCKSNDQASREISIFKNYYEAAKDGGDEKWNYTEDTVRQWFDDKNGDPIVQVKGQASTGRWKEWDEEMNANSYYDSIWYNEAENAVQGYFYENNDFYQLIGKGPTKTLRTYWFDNNDKINEFLIYWIPEENTTTTENLKPIVEWAMKNDSTEIMELYPDNRIIPSRENAIRWKVLLTRYNESK